MCQITTRVCSAVVCGGAWALYSNIRRSVTPKWTVVVRFGPVQVCRIIISQLGRVSLRGLLFNVLISPHSSCCSITDIPEWLIYAAQSRTWPNPASGALQIGVRQSHKQESRKCSVPLAADAQFSCPSLRVVFPELPGNAENASWLVYSCILSCL